ncbi:MAG: hypothetical protein MK075_00420, partial [Phycisphaerales bacterium]|nr:hypothetical protein [Phycisphaerales bacterium]
MSSIDTNTVWEIPGERAPFVDNHDSLSTVTAEVLQAAESPKPPLGWYIALSVSSLLASMFGLMIGYLFFTGVGVWGNANPVMWGFPIVNFVFWVGIGHAGTLISAILFLFR